MNTLQSYVHRRISSITKTFFFLILQSIQLPTRQWTLHRGISLNQFYSVQCTSLILSNPAGLFVIPYTCKAILLWFVIVKRQQTQRIIFIMYNTLLWQMPITALQLSLNGALITLWSNNTHTQALTT